MNPNHILTALCILSISGSAAAILLYRHRTRLAMKNMSAMLEEAISGRFSETHFDESMLSSVEMKLAQYLANSKVSTRNLEVEKDKIKELISDISHQTKTPIANILLYAQLLEEQNLPKESADCVKALNDQAEKLNFLIQALIKTSRLETGIITLAPKADRITSMLEQVVKQVMPKAEQKSIRIEVKRIANSNDKSDNKTGKTNDKTADNKTADKKTGKTNDKFADNKKTGKTNDKSSAKKTGNTNNKPADEKTVEINDITAVFDRKWTAEAIHNILDNAIKYTPNGGTIQIKVIPYEFFIRIDITDTGIGIQEQEHSMIFKRFYRSPSVQNADGLGIGLYLARQIISGEGGYIKVSSLSGEGSTFSVFLPRQA